ncbi:MAG: hypothetical protein ABI781_10935 [Burkholderiales bacterium]
MSGGSMPPERVPTLTEVVSWPHSTAPVVGEMQLSLPTVEARPAEADMVVAPLQPLRVADEEMVQGVLVEVQRQVELMLDYRLREVLTPLLNRAADGIVRDARAELASTLRDVVARAVAQELARHRTR